MKAMAMVFDTNIITGNNKGCTLEALRPDLLSLQSSYDLYLPQIVIDERISQLKNIIKSDYDSLTGHSKNFAYIADISPRCPLEEKCKSSVDELNNHIHALFSNNIIPFVPSAEMATLIWERARDCIYPFKKTKDKDKQTVGIKDTVLWLSLIDFFRPQSYTYVKFVTNDGDFRGNDSAPYLTNEFKEQTNSEIEIISKDNFDSLVRNASLEKSETPILSEKHLATQHNNDGVTKSELPLVGSPN